jgi:hypothetical protein
MASNLDSCNGTVLSARRFIALKLMLCTLVYSFCIPAHWIPYAFKHTYLHE